MRTTRRILASMATAGALAAGLAAPAHADQRPNSRCPIGYVCFWTGPLFTGEIKVYNSPTLHTCGPTTAAPAYTVYNNDDEDWSFYADQNCSTLVKTLSPGQFFTLRPVNSWK